MRTLQNAALAGAAAVLLCGAFSFAAAQDSHVMTVRLPGGAAEHIRYTGEVPPKVEIEPQSPPALFGWPAAFFEPAPFAALDRISEEMDRQLAAAIRETNALAAEPFPDAKNVAEIEAGNLPAGSEHYSFVSTSGGKVFCARSVEITSRGAGEKPRVVSRSYGNCGSTGAPVGSSTRSGADSLERQDAARAIDYSAPPSGGLLQEASAVR